MVTANPHGDWEAYCERMEEQQREAEMATMSSAAIQNALIESVIDYGRACADELPEAQRNWLADVREKVEGIQQNAYAEGRKDEAEEHAWRPIESAPEDENVLVATEGGHVDCAFWTDDGDGPKWWWLVSANEYAKHPLHPNLIPTHWMPLPKHPHRVPTTIGKSR
jgi:hypothetical protein